MIPLHDSFVAEVIRQKFVAESGREYPLTANIQFHKKGVEESLEMQMGSMDEESIYSAIDRGEELILDHCFIERFSLKEYRLSRKMEPRHKVSVKGFSALHSLWGGGTAFDLSYSILEGMQFSLEGAWIHRGDMVFEGAIFKTGITTFHDARFPDGIFNFKNVTVESKEISFKNCVFGRGEKDFQYANFGSAGTTFVNADFQGGDVNFINTDFGAGDISFKVARFGDGKVDFHFSTFKEGNTSFERTEFGNGRVDFRTVEFGKGRINFNRSQFGRGEVAFDESEKEGGKFNFKRATFGPGDISFDDVMFEHVDMSFERTSFGQGKLSFYRSWFHSLALDFCHLDGFVDLRLNQCSSLNLSNTIVRDIIDLNPNEFKANIGTLSIEGMRLIGRIYIDWKLNNVKQLISGQEAGTHRIKAEQYRILKENFKNLGHYHDEDMAYVEFKREESRAELAESLANSRISAIYQYPVYLFKLGLFDRAGLYATSPFRVLITMISVYLVFSVIYVLMLSFTPADIVASVDDQLTVVVRSFYHSAITFLTIGYGDHFPYGAVRWVSSLEGFLGLFLMSYFTVAFVRKVLR